MQIARIVVAVMLAATACADEGLSKEEFIERADAICRESEEQTEEIEPPRTPEELAGFVDEAERITGDLLRKLRDLEAPEEDRQEIDALLNKIQEALGHLPEIGRAAEEESAERIKQLGRELRDVSAEANEMARDYGFEVCGREQAAPAP